MCVYSDPKWFATLGIGVVISMFRMGLLAEGVSILAQSERYYDSCYKQSKGAPLYRRLSLGIQTIHPVHLY
jgi:hypothetical protein